MGMGRKPKSEDPVYTRIEQHRVRAGLSRQELADAVGVHYQTVGYLERGEYAPSLALALRISALVEVPVEQLFSLIPFADSET
jgi:DNA-binding XRE family transcriptional regulator